MDKQDALERGLHPFVGPGTTFAEAFPTIATLLITLEMRGDGITSSQTTTRTFTLQDPPGEYIRCPRGSACNDGGWRVTEFIREMVAKRKTSREARGGCRGRERGRSPRGCKAYFTAKIEITYKAE